MIDGRMLRWWAVVSMMAVSLCWAGNAERRRRKNVGNLKQLGLGCLMYSGDFSGKFPNTLEVLKNDDYLPDGDVYLWTHPGTGKTHNFMYCPGLRDDDVNPTGKYVAAAPKAFDGKREVLFIDGHVAMVDEKEFVKQAKRQGWKIKFIPEQFKGKPELKKAVEELIPKLGAESFKERRKARKALEKMGDEILPLLQQHLKNDDPEIRGNVQEAIDTIFGQK